MIKMGTMYIVCISNIVCIREPLLLLLLLLFHFLFKNGSKARNLAAAAASSVLLATDILQHELSIECYLSNINVLNKETVCGLWK